jgi:hypothetical protein
LIALARRGPIHEFVDSEGGLTMIARFMACALACTIFSPVAGAEELAPGNAHSVHLDRVDGVVYYSVEQDGYRVVATLASGGEESPIRVISTLGPDQSIVISVPQAVDQPPVDIEILRTGGALFVSEPVPSATSKLAD